MSVTAESVEVRAPAGQEEGTRSQVLRWLKAVGEPVAEHEPLIELDTDKVTVEVASPGAGILTEILKQEQEEVAPGELLGRIAPATMAAALASRRAGASLGTSQEVSASRAASVPHAAGAPDRDRAGGGAVAPASSGTLTAGSRGGAAARPLSPAVRRLLGEHSLDPAAIRGTGEGGRITVADVMREISGASRPGVGAGTEVREASTSEARSASAAVGSNDTQA